MGMGVNSDISGTGTISVISLFRYLVLYDTSIPNQIQIRS